MSLPAMACAKNSSSRIAIVACKSDRVSPKIKVSFGHTNSSEPDRRCFRDVRKSFFARSVFKGAIEPPELCGLRAETALDPDAALLESSSNRGERPASECPQ